MMRRDRLSEVDYRDKEFQKWEADLVGSIDRFAIEDNLLGENVSMIQATPGPSFSGSTPSFYLPMCTLKRLPVFTTRAFETLSNHAASVAPPKSVMRVSYVDYATAEKEGRVFL